MLKVIIYYELSHRPKNRPRDSSAIPRVGEIVAQIKNRETDGWTANEPHTTISRV